MPPGLFEKKLLVANRANTANRQAHMEKYNNKYTGKEYAWLLVIKKIIKLCVHC